MKATLPTKKQQPRMELVQLSKSAALRKEYMSHLPAWRRPIVGYMLSLPLVALFLVLSMLIEQLLRYAYFPGSLLILSVLLSAFIWGVGPALLSLLFCIFALDYFLIPPTWHLDLNTLKDALQLVPFAISGLVIAFITAQRERARLEALAAEYEAKNIADQLEESYLKLEESNEKLQEASQLKDRFLSIASHELKTPITTIRGQAQLLLRRLNKQRELTSEMEGVKKTLEKINEQTGRLTALIDELLDVSSIHAGKMELHKHSSNLVMLCRDIIDDQHLLSGRTITFTAAQPEIMMEIDSDRIGQVVVNLVGNALKYSPPPRPVEVSLNVRQQWAYLRVTDHGNGVPKEQQERIFETFYRAPGAEVSAKGLGLGLAICKEIVERHAGRIWCESQPDVGSTFCVELPLMLCKD